MEGLRKKLQTANAFFRDVLVEMRKCTWPERGELLESTVVVITLLLMVSMYVALCDKVLVEVLRLLIPRG